MFWYELRNTVVLNYSHQIVHCNVLVSSDDNKSQYIHMLDKGYHIFDIGDACLYLNAGNSTIPLNLFPERRP